MPPNKHHKNPTPVSVVTPILTARYAGSRGQCLASTLALWGTSLASSYKRRELGLIHLQHLLQLHIVIQTTLQSF